MSECSVLLQYKGIIKGVSIQRGAPFNNHRACLLKRGFYPYKTVYTNNRGVLVHFTSEKVKTSWIRYFIDYIAL